MPINNIPGVGPTNADIATAVAAPSSSTIATAVAAAVPTLSQINTAVNTQTNNSAIASAVAAAVPTTAGITSIVQANAGSPFAGTYTNISTVTPTVGTQSTTISGLSGYKYIKAIMFFQSNGGTPDFFLRINGSGGVAHHSTASRSSKSSTTAFNTLYYSNGKSDTYIRPNGGMVMAAQAATIRFDIRDNNATVPFKDLNGTMHWYENGSNAVVYTEWNGQAWTTSAISDITFMCINNSFGSGTTISLWGAN